MLEGIGGILASSITVVDETNVVADGSPHA